MFNVVLMHMNMHLRYSAVKQARVPDDVAILSS